MIPLITRKRSVRLTSVLFSMLTTGMLAQTTIPAGSAASTNGETDPETLTLETFSVSTSKKSEYVAAESITGTRVAVNLRDLPFTVNVVTSEFLDDFAAFEFAEQLSYTSGVVPFESLTNGYAVRGIDSNVQLRNGFRRIGLIDKVNVDRIEVIKGAAASIYGSVMPGGTVNILTKKPEAKRQDRISIAAGTNDLLRAQASSTGPLGDTKKLFYRVDLAAQKMNYDTPYEKMEQWTIVPQLLWKPNANTSLLVEYEHLNRDETTNSNVPLVRSYRTDPYRANGATFIGYDRIATEIFNFNSAGPESIQNRSTHTATATFEHRFNRRFSMRSSANWFTRSREREELNSREFYDPLSDSVATGNAVTWPIKQDGAAWQTDFLALWDTGNLKHQTLLTIDYQRQTEWAERFDARTVNVRITDTATNVARTRAISLAYPGASAAIAALPTTVVSGVTLPWIRLPGIGSSFMLGETPTVLNYDGTLGIPINNPTYRYISYAADPSLYRKVYDYDNSLDIYGAFLSHRVTMLDNRVTGFGGVRYDYVDSHSRDYVAGINQSRSVDAVSYQIGANVRVIRPVTAYVNVARSFVPDFTTGIDRDGSLFNIPNEVGTTKEVGFKAALFDELFTFTMAYFDIERKNVRRDASYEDENRVRQTYDVVNGSETSKGFEFDYNWVVLPKRLQFFGQYSYIDSEIHDAVATPAFNGGPTRRTPRHRYGSGLKYSFTEGVLKGFAVTAGYRYEGRSRGVGPGARVLTASSVTAANPFVNTPMPNGDLPVPTAAPGAVLTSLPAGTVLWLPDGRETIYNPAYELVETGVSYSWRDKQKHSHKLQLNVRNLLDKRYTFASNGQGPGREFILTYDIRF